MANAYLLHQFIGENRVDILKTDSFRERFERFSMRLSGELKQISNPMSGVQYTHHLGLDTRFLDFLRLSVGISRIEQEDALRLKEIVDRAIGEFINGKENHLSHREKRASYRCGDMGGGGW